MGYMERPKQCLEEVGWEVVEWIDMAQDRDSWRVFVNTPINYV
jgi:hypothetical protein